jgi:hypothetical protein
MVQSAKKEAINRELRRLRIIYDWEERKAAGGEKTLGELAKKIDELQNELTKLLKENP